MNLDDSPIDAALTAATDPAVETLAQCKTACSDATGCTHYHLEGVVCRLHTMGYVQLKGDGVPLKGKCYKLPAAPLNYEGACIISNG